MKHSETFDIIQHDPAQGLWHRVKNARTISAAKSESNQVKFGVPLNATEMNVWEHFKRICDIGFWLPGTLTCEFTQSKCIIYLHKKRE